MLQLFCCIWYAPPHYFLYHFHHASFPHYTLLWITILVNPQANPSQNDKRQTSLDHFFENGWSAENPNHKRAEDTKTANKKKVALKREYWESYLNYEFIVQVIHSLQAQFV